jgi:hypothetical protein
MSKKRKIRSRMKKGKGRDAVKKIVYSHLDFAGECLKRDGYLVPFAAIITADGPIYYPMDFSEEVTPVAGLRMLCEKYNALMAIIVMDAYESRDLSGIAPSEAQDRQEILVAQYEDSKSSRAFNQYYERDEDGNIRFGKRIERSIYIPLTFSDIIPKRSQSR